MGAPPPFAVSSPADWGVVAVFSNDLVCLAMTPVVARLCLQRGLNPLLLLIGLACAANIGSATSLIGNPQNTLIGAVLKLHFADHARPAPTQARTVSGPFDRWQTTKGMVVATALMVVFQFTDWPRDVAALVGALVGAGVLLLSRRFHSADVIGALDWPLLLFIGLFVVNHAFEQTGLSARAVAWLAVQGVHLSDPGALGAVWGWFSL